MLEQLTEKFKVRGCHLLADLEYSYKSDYISGMVVTPFCFCFFINYFYFLRVILETIKREKSVSRVGLQ